MTDRIPPKEMAERLARTLRKQRPDREYLKKVFAYVRTELELRGPGPQKKKLPELLTNHEIERFYEAVWNAADRTHRVMLKLLVYTGVRNAELANIRVSDIDMNDLTVRIEAGKGEKDRYVPIPRSFRGELAQYVDVQCDGNATYLFETNRLDKFTTRWIRAVVKRYADQAEIKKRIYPHLFRHQLLTHLARHGISDAKIQLVSGHDSRKSLEIYHSLSLADVSEDYQRAMEEFPVK